MADVREQVGSRSPKGGGGSPLKWLWLLLGLLALALLGWLILSNVTDENDEAGIDAGDDEISATEEDADAGADSGTEQAAGSADCPDEADAGEQLFSDLEGIVGCRVVAEVTVGEVADDNTFTITEGGTEITVVDGSKGAVLEAGQTIRMEGEVREFSFSEIDEELDLEKDEAEYERYEGQTVVVADSTTPAE